MIWFGGVLPDLAGFQAHTVGTAIGHLGIAFSGVGDDWIAARMPVDHRTRQPYGLLHGGASVLLAETLGSMGAAAVVDPAKSRVVGLEINANHVRPATDGFVTGTARPEAIGRTTQIWSIRIENEAGKLVCISRITMAVIPAG